MEDPDVLMPASFPATEFAAFGAAAEPFFPHVMSSEAKFDPLEKRRQFDWSWQAVRYRYRTCAECADELKQLEPGPAGLGYEEWMYKLDRCIYLFFTSALSVFDSFAFCLYFLGNAIDQAAFVEVNNPRRITRRTTSTAFTTTFPQATITGFLANLSTDPAFDTIDDVRNRVGHRLSGRRSIYGSSTTWHLPGSKSKLTFDAELLQRHLEDIRGLLIVLACAAREFAASQKPAATQR
jgi:hypothetical protein